MSSSYGEIIRLTIFGQSHSPAIGMTLEGIPAGSEIDREELQRFLARRAPGQNAYSTPRKEADTPEFLSGIQNNITCGVPLTAIIRNTDTRSSDYAEFKTRPRPGHADLTGEIKYHGAQDAAGGGHFSGRMTAPLCIAGGILKQLLQKEGIRIFARIISIEDVEDEGDFTAPVEDKGFPVVSEEKGRQMQSRIEAARKEGDSVGGIIECRVENLPAGLGDPMFSGMENKISAAIFAIPGIRGIEFGTGFAAARMRGSQHNDPFGVEDGRVVTLTNHAGGILGGITNAMPVIFRVAVKPTPSIAAGQSTVDLERMEPARIEIKGRHDPCIVPRAVPCIEAAAAIAIYDAYLAYKTQN